MSKCELNCLWKTSYILSETTSPLICHHISSLIVMDIDNHEFGLVLCIVFEVVSDHGGVLGRHAERCPLHKNRFLHDLIHIL